jgi:hypothetical protein
MGDPAEPPALLPAAVVPCPPVPRPGRLVCPRCRRTTDCLTADLARHMRAGDWPRCCTEVMAFYVPAGKPWEPTPSAPRDRTLAE